MDTKSTITPKVQKKSVLLGYTTFSFHVRLLSVWPPYAQILDPPLPSMENLLLVVQGDQQRAAQQVNRTCLVWPTHPLMYLIMYRNMRGSNHIGAAP